MNESIKITAVMVRDHRKIQDLLDDFEEKTKQDYKTMVKSYVES